ncbi:hypothetical protein ABZ816_01465 [Actinosynnema sp. NPDC047251]|uniref:Putative secreted protein n=1 Tax=Saccharothrix espanaensis (strain ATCC 51144 / DSM 44229 / JCM 9112 / NBRC 15066 / NRRL 15764) TaxID=1179773 RepID=K0K219_SACES|nr:hypothetical protein [Saccharothrix espanaensis]CCH30919.1 putative secreted protein [Saccharothrix espanaensis DSM 44229]
MSIIRRALLIIPASLAAVALSGAVAQAGTDDAVVFGDDNTVTNTHTNNTLVWIDDSFNNIETVDVEWTEHNHGHGHGHGHGDHDGDDD